MRAGDKAIYLVALVTVACAVGVIAIPSAALRLPLSLLLACYLPGSAFLWAAFRSPRIALTGLVFAAGLSIAATVLCGFALHLAGAMTREGWAIALCAVTLVGLYVARIRRSRGFESRPYLWPPLRPVRVAMVFAAAGLALAAVAAARQQSLARSEFAYTEFWMVPESGRGLVVLGVKNAETAASTYDVEVSVDDAVAQVWRGIPLAAGESWRTEFTLPPQSASSKGIQAWLFKDNDHSVVYRRVWLPALPAPAGE
jgi:uncharacterized membrane protein